jgi:hypothetical protein
MTFDRKAAADVLIGTAIAAAVLLIAFAAFAQQPAMYRLLVTNDQLNLIGKALGKMPFEEVYQTIDIIRGQVAAQNAEAAKKPDPPPAETPKPPEPEAPK